MPLGLLRVPLGPLVWPFKGEGREMDTWMDGWMDR